MKPLESRRSKQRCPRESKRLLEEALIFKHRPEIGRVIFMSTPHRGSDLASNWIGRIGSMLVKTPSKLLTIGHTISEALTRRSRRAAVEGLSQQRRYAGAEQPLRHGDQQDPDHARHSVSHHRGRSGKGRYSQQQRWRRRLLEQSSRRRAQRVYRAVQSQLAA